MYIFNKYPRGDSDSHQNFRTSVSVKKGGDKRFERQGKTLLKIVACWLCSLDYSGESGRFKDFRV